MSFIEDGWPLLHMEAHSPISLHDDNISTRHRRWYL